MPTTNITRFLFQPRKAYVGARLQQGRVLLDADFNERACLEAEDWRNSVLDLAGGRGSPDTGFSLGRAPGTGEIGIQPLRRGDLVAPATVQLGGVATSIRPVFLRPGSLYVGGWRLELEQAEALAFQRDFLQMGSADVAANLDSSKPYQILYYLTAWEQEISSVEDEGFRESALGGSDTGIRVRRMRRVAAMVTPWANQIGTAWAQLGKQLSDAHVLCDPKTGELRSQGRLQLLVRPQVASAACGSCSNLADSRFLGAANQTLRIMLTAADRYVWTLADATPLLRVRVTGLTSPSSATPIEVEVVSPLVDVRQFPREGRVVEIVPFAAILDGPDSQPHAHKVADRVGAFSRVSGSYNPETRRFVLDGNVGIDAIRSLVTQWDPTHPEAARLNYTPESGSDARLFYMRLWHDAPTAQSVELPIAADPYAGPLAGTHVVPMFTSRGRRGDYWIAALRPDAGQEVVPVDLTWSGGVPPHGPREFIAPLALVEGNANNTITCNADARLAIRRVVSAGCLTYAVGDGVRTHGDFSCIQDAINALKTTGGRILVREGTYRERLTFSKLSDVLVESCGEGVVIETPPPDPNSTYKDDTALVDIVDCTGVELRGLVFHAVGERCLRVRGSSHDVHVRNAIMRTGLRVGDAFLPGVQNPWIPLVDVAYADGLELTNVVLEPIVQPALQIAADRVRLVNIVATGERTSIVRPVLPQVRLSGCHGVVLEESRFTAYGQTAVAVEGVANSEITLQSLAIVVGQHRSSTHQVTPSRSGVDVEGGTDIRLEDSWITMDESQSDCAAAAVGGDTIAIIGNHFEVLARCVESPSPSPASPSNCSDMRVQAWGGLQIRGGARHVEVRGNQILGGVGHGITLGSLVWRASGATTVLQRDGAGRGQMMLRPDGHLGASGRAPAELRTREGATIEAVSEGVLTNVVITDNHIEQMSGNGISVLSVLGMPKDALVELLGLRIENNVVVGNLRHPGPDIPLSTANLGTAPGSLVTGAAAVPILPLGGIVLASVVRANLCGNVIENNGASHVDATNGIFVLAGDSLSIHGNRIVGNGLRAEPESPHMSPPPGPKPGIRAGIAVLLAGVGEADSLSTLADVTTSSGRNLDDSGSSVRVHDNVVRHPEGRALHVVATGPVSIVGNLFSSEGNHGAETYGDLYMVGDVVFVQNLGVPSEAILATKLSTEIDHRPVAGNLRAVLDVSSPSAYDRRILGEDGRVLFQGNQVTFDWEILRTPHLGSRPPLAFFPVALVTSDKLSVESNQFAMRMRGRFGPDESPQTSPPLDGYHELVFGHVLAIGATVQANHNRLSETVGSVILSLVTLGELMNMATFNQTTHEILTFTHSYGTDDQSALVSRQVVGGHGVLPPGMGTGSNPKVALCSQLQEAPPLYFSAGGVLPSDAEFELIVLSNGAPTSGESINLIYRAKNDTGWTNATANSGTLTLPNNKGTLTFENARYLANSYYVLPNETVMIPSGTWAPPIFVKPTAGAVLDNLFVELAIVTEGSPQSSSQLRVQLRTQSDGEPFSYPVPATGLFTASGLDFRFLPVKYRRDNVYRCTTYQPVGPLLPKGTPSSTLNVTVADSGLMGAYRVVVDILTSGTTSSTASTTTAPLFRYSLDGGRHWSQPLTMTTSSYVIPDSGISLTFGAGTFSARQYYEFETFTPELSRDVELEWLGRMGNQVMFKPDGIAMSSANINRLMRYAESFVKLLVRMR